MYLGDGGNLDGGINFDGTEMQAKIYSGNTFQNFDDAAEQPAYYPHWRVQGGSWQVLTGNIVDATLNDEYWLATIDLSGVSSGSVMQYYLELHYSDASNTFIYTHNSTKTYSPASRIWRRPSRSSSTTARLVRVRRFRNRGP